MASDKNLINDNFNVYFTRELQSSIYQDLKTPAVVFSPIESGWNDFTYKIRYRYTVLSISKNGSLQEIQGDTFLGFVEKDKRLSSGGQVYIPNKARPASEVPPFFTLLAGMEDYRRFLSEHGVEKANKLLLSFNDLVALRHRTKQPAWLKDALETNIFKFAFMRNSEPFFAFHNAASLLGGLEGEELGKMSNKLSLTYSLDGFSREHQLDLNFSFDDILPKRISVLIGRNGLGKSQALASIVNSLMKRDKRLIDKENGRPMISRVLAIATPGETINTFPAERNNKQIKYKRLILNRSSKSRSSRGFGEMCVQLVRSEEYIGGQTRWDLFVTSMSTWDQVGEIVLPLDNTIETINTHVLSVRNKQYIPLKELHKGGEKAKLEIWGAILRNATPLKLIGNSLYPLSSGQSAFLKFSLQACLFIENGTLVLLDEPETHLHPNFISEFVRLLDMLLASSGSTAVVATHSAYFVREMPRSQVLVFKEDNTGSVFIDHPRLKTFGADIGSISYFVFEDEITNALVEDLIERLPEDAAKAKSIISELNDELSSEVIMYLRRRLKLEDKDV